MLKVYLLLLLIVVSQQYSIINTDWNKIENSSEKLSGKLPIVAALRKGDKREVLYYEKTIAVLDSNEKNKLFRCEIVNVGKPEQVPEAVLQMGVAPSIVPFQSPMDKMLLVLEDCDALDIPGANYVDIEHDKQVAIREITLEQVEKITQISVLPGIIFPGTKWCGFGNKALFYSDLGSLRDTDRCCRSHDLCPINIASKDTQYGITNEATHTVSHCACDVLFHSCLKAVNGWTSAILGQIYFKAVTKCIKGFPFTGALKLELVPLELQW